MLSCRVRAPPTGARNFWKQMMWYNQPDPNFLIQKTIWQKLDDYLIKVKIVVTFIISLTPKFSLTIAHLKYICITYRLWLNRTRYKTIHCIFTHLLNQSFTTERLAIAEFLWLIRPCLFCYFFLNNILFTSFI